MLEGDEARKAIDDERREQAGRRSLQDRPGFEQISPELGQLDEGAFDRFLDEHPDAAMTLLADLTGTVDADLRALARRLASRVFLDVARTVRARSRGVGPPRSVPADQALGDLDLDGSLEALTDRRVTGTRARTEDLRVIELRRPTTGLCLVIDRSGSMGGERLATAAVAAAAVAWRAHDDHSVLAFGERVLVVKSQDRPRPVAEVTDDLLRLRGHGTTDLDAALRAAGAQLERSRSGRKLVLLLSDGRATAGPDPVDAARSLPELVILAPGNDRDDADALARGSGARVCAIDGPSSVPAALAQVFA